VIAMGIEARPTIHKPDLRILRMISKAKLVFNRKLFTIGFIAQFCFANWYF
jgi:hypothetical protein